MKLRIAVAFISAVLLVSACTSDEAERAEGEPSQAEWIQLFNGTDLSGWTAKISGYELGENPGNTFRVENGLLKVVYDEYDEWGDEFGHLFYEEPFSHYLIRVEYRFVGDQLPGAPDWAFRNNGVMLHCQAPETMGVDQDFPVSIEAQLLGGNGVDQRPTGNLATPGTHVVIDGELETQHVINSTSQTYHGDVWVTVEIEVYGDSLIRHVVEGDVVMEYSSPQLDDSPESLALAEQAGTNRLTRGWIAIQAESHPIEFRKIELRRLDASS
jgi:hypothetical protein